MDPSKVNEGIPYSGPLIPIFLTVFGLIVGFLGVEVALRLISSSVPKTDRPPFYFQPEGADTLQDYSRSEKSPGAFRIAVIGDSYSFAPYMQFTDAFPKILERMLNLNKSQRKVEVLNYGVPGYSTTHEVAEFKRAAKDDGADLILLQITLNDPEMKPYRPTGISVFGQDGRIEGSGLWSLMLRHSRLIRLVADRWRNEKSKRDFLQYYQDLFAHPKGFHDFKASLRWMSEISRDHKVPMLAVVFPLFAISLGDDYPFLDLHAKVGGVLEGLGVRTLDLFQAYKGLPLERLQVIPEVDRHPNEIAHRIAAEQIYLFLEQHNLIPDDVRIKRRYSGRTQLSKEKPL